MATDPPPIVETPALADRGWKPYLLDVRQFLTMIDAGVFPRNARVELMGGVLVRMRTRGNPHDYSVGSIAEDLRRLAPEGWIVREEKSLQLGPRSSPQPDVAIVRGPRRQYDRRTPHARETALVVEVAESSYAYDRGQKWRACAAARIPIYWIVNLAKNQIEVYSDPTGRGKDAGYRQAMTFGRDAEVPFAIEGVDLGRISVTDVLPRSRRR